MVAVDAMGGDLAPLEICKGVLIAAKQGIPITLFGPEEQLQRILDDQDPLWQSYLITLVHAPDQIEMGEEPVSALRKKPNSSLVLAVASVKAGQCDSVISAGSSGALMAAAILILGRLPGVERPCIAGFLPTRSGRPIVALDLGACVECKPSYLYQFAHLGVAYAELILGIKFARVGLLANGSEDSKGTTLTKEAFSLLKNSSLTFIGNVEPEDIFHHKIDVLVCDGFAGNVLLKTMEATCSGTLAMVGRHIQELQTVEERAVALKLIKKTENSLMLADQGGALLLGVQGTVVVAHGNSTGLSIARAIALAARSSGKDQLTSWIHITDQIFKKREMSL